MFQVGQLQKDKHQYPVEAKVKEVREVLESSARTNGPGGYLPYCLYLVIVSSVIIHFPPLTANSLFRVSKHNPLRIRLLVQPCPQLKPCKSLSAARGCERLLF